MMPQTTPKRERVTTTGGTGSIACPFFLGHSAHEIHCEGIEDQSRIILRYRRACDQQRQEHLFCERNYPCCEIYRMLMRDKYDIQGGGL